MAESSTNFDFATMSVYEICQAIRNKAGGGDFPEHVPDFGSSVILSLASSENSDLHVEYNPPPHLSQLTGLAPAIQRNQRPGQHQSQLDDDNSEHGFDNDGWPLPSNDVNELELFEYPKGFSTPPGPIGPPLMTYGKWMAVGASYGLNMTGFDHHFRSRWFIPADADLSPVIPKVRCLDGFLLGVDKKPVPCVMAYPQYRNYVKVKRHPRQNFEGKMINWPRIDAIAKANAMISMFSFSSTPPKSSRIDFTINARELPTRPTPLWLEKFPVLNEWEVRDTFLPAVEYLSNFKRNVN